MLHNGDFRPRYIGQTRRTPLERMYQHRYDARGAENHPLYNWMRKHGPENIQMCVIWEYESDSFEDMRAVIDMQEAFYIAQEKAYSDDNLNIREGGGSGYHSPETKAKMSIAQSGPKNPAYGKAMHENTRKALIAANSKPCSPEKAAKISAANTGKVLSDEHIANLKLGSHRRYHVKRSIVNPNCALCTVEP